MAAIYNVITKIISMGGNKRSQMYFLKYVSREMNILNVGCGSVSFGIHLAAKCNNVTAIDISSEMLSIAKKHAIKINIDKNIRFICQDINTYNPGPQYDIVFANFFLNTFRPDDVFDVLKHVLSMVKPNGLLCIADETEAKKISSKLELKLFRPIFAFLHHVLADHPFHPIYNYTPLIEKEGFVKIDENIDKSDYICSFVFKKKDY